MNFLKLNVLLGLLIFQLSALAQTTPCQPQGSNPCYSLYIDNFRSFNAYSNVNNSSGLDSSDYGDYSSQVITLDSTFWLDYSITFNDTAYLDVWIDLNRDGDFDDAQEQLLHSGTNRYLSLRDTLQIPGSAYGAYYLRVRGSNNPTTNWNSCSVTNCGEVEDYILDIKYRRDLALTGLNKTRLCSSDSLQLYFENKGLDNISQYQFSGFIGALNISQTRNKTLAPGEIDSLNVFAFPSGSFFSDSISISINSVNTGTDSRTQNNSLNSRIYLKMAGPYSLGGSGSSFNSLEGALDSLRIFGICASVTLNLQTASYTQAHHISAFPESESDSLIIQTDPGLSSRATIESGISLDSAGLVFLKDLNFSRTNSSGSHVLIKGQNEHLDVDSCGFYDTRSTEGMITSNSLTATDDFVKFLEVKNSSFQAYFKDGIWISKQLNGDFHCKAIIEGNRFDSLRTSIRIFGFDSVFVHNNQSEGMHSQFQGATPSQPGTFWFESCHFVDIQKNEFFDARLGLNNTTYGRVINNRLLIEGHPNNSDALHQFRSDSLEVFHNNFLFTSSHPHSFNKALIEFRNKFTDFSNNIVASKGVRSQIPLLDVDSGFVGTNNVYYHPRQEYFIINSQNDLEFFQLQKILNTDSSSSVMDPMLDEFHQSRNINLRQSMSQIQAVSDDINSNIRTNNVTPGCDELLSRSKEAGIMELKASNICELEAGVDVVLQNNGTDTLRSAHLSYSFKRNDTLVQQGDSSFTISLGSGQQTSLNFRPLSFDKRSYYQLEVMLDSIDHQLEISPGDNQKTTDSLRAQLAGSYTVGGTNPDYIDLSQAVNDLKDRGVCSATQFLIRPGVYIDSYRIDSVPYYSSIKHIVFRKDTNFIGTAELQGGSANSVFDLIDASYIRIEGLSFQSKGIVSGTGSQSSPKVVKELSFYNNEFKDCSEAIQVVGSHRDSIYDLKIEHNQFDSCNRSLNLVYANEIKVVNNEFNSSLSNDMTVNDCRSSIIEGNHFDSKSVSSNSNIRISRSQFEIRDNVMHSAAKNGIHVTFPDPRSTLDTNLIVNNSILLEGDSNSAVYALRFEKVRALIWHNTVLINSINDYSGSACVRLEDYSANRSDSIEIKNNILRNLGSSWVYSFRDLPIKLDYNLIHSNSTQVAHWNAFPKTLTGLRNDFNQSQNTSYGIQNLQSVKNHRLSGAGPAIAAGTNLGVQFDLDGYARNLPPSIGAFEWSEWDFSLNDADSMICLGQSRPSLSLCTNGGRIQHDSLAIVWSVKEGASPFQLVDTLWVDSLAAPGECIDDIPLSAFVFDSTKNYQIKASIFSISGQIDTVPNNDSLYFQLQLFTPLAKDILGPDTVICSSNLFVPGLPSQVISWEWKPPYQNNINRQLPLQGQSNSTQAAIVHNVMVDYESPGGCLGSDSIEVIFGNADDFEMEDSVVVCDTLVPIELTPPSRAASWLWNGIDTSNVYEVLSNDTVHLSIEDTYGCSGSDSTIYIIRKCTSSIGFKDQLASEIAVYPNPSSGRIFINTSESKVSYRYELLDLNGKLISRKQVKDGTVLDLKLSQGFYFFRLFNELGEKLYEEKLVILP